MSGNAVKIADLVTGLTSPVVAPMPTRDDPVPMPAEGVTATSSPLTRQYSGTELSACQLARRSATCSPH